MMEATEQVERSAAYGAERIKRGGAERISAYARSAFQLAPGRRLRAEGGILGMMATPVTA